MNFFATMLFGNIIIGCVDLKMVENAWFRGCDYMPKQEAIENYKIAVLDMLRHVSCCSTVEFIDSVNIVLKARNELLKYDVSVEEAMK